MENNLTEVLCLYMLIDKFVLSLCDKSATVFINLCNSVNSGVIR